MAVLMLAEWAERTTSLLPVATDSKPGRVPLAPAMIRSCVVVIGLLISPAEPGFHFPLVLS